MEHLLTLPDGRVIKADVLRDGVIAIHAPLGDRKGRQMTYVPLMATIWTFDPPNAQKRATAWRQRLEACDDWPDGPECRAAVAALRKEEA